MSVREISDPRHSSGGLWAVATLSLVAVIAACPGKTPCTSAADCPAESGKVASCSNGSCAYAAVVPCTTEADCPPGEACLTNPADGKLECQPQPTCQNDVGCPSGEVCRNAVCAVVSCANATQCALGETCDTANRDGGVCNLTGCRSDADCPSGQKCQIASNTCVQCLVNADCPPARPTCLNSKCVACQTDADCANAPSPHCNLSLGLCVDCAKDTDCAPGLVCNGQGTCSGVQPGGACQTFPLSPVPCATNSDCTVAAYPDCLSYGNAFACGRALTCDVGGLCVGYSDGTYKCALECSPYDPSACPLGQGCGLLSAAPGVDAFVFGQPLGACINQPAGASGYGQSCTGNAYCKNGLFCVPVSAAGAECTNFCDPVLAAKCDGGNCAAGCNADAGDTCNQVFVGAQPGEYVGVCFPPSPLYKFCSDDQQCDPDAGCGCSIGRVPQGPPLNPDYSGWGNVCNFAPGNKTALEACSTNNDCTSGVCITHGNPSTGMYCYGACASGLDCPGGVCESWQFTINVSQVPINFTVSGCRGSACQSDSDCAATPPRTTCNLEPDPSSPSSSLVLRCEPPLGTGAAGAPCSPDAGNSECATGICLSGVPVDGGTTNLCWGACNPIAANACPSGLTCNPTGVTFTAVDGTQVAEPACLP